MDATAEKNCMEEISALIFDALQKVTLKTVSNNWLVSNDVAQQILNKWLLQNEKKLKELVKEFLVHGINSNGKLSIAVVNEETKKRLEAKWKNVKVCLYSVETKSNSRDLVLTPKYEEIKLKKILFDCGDRDLKVPVAVKQEPIDTTKIKTPFGMVKPIKKEDEKKPVVPQEKAKKQPVEVKQEQPVEVKKESPKKSPPSASSKPSTSNNKKNGKTSQKGNISSFFNKPSTVTKNEVKPEPKKEPKQELKKEPSPEVQEEASTSRKRSASPPPTKLNNDKKKPPQKKPKLKEPKNKKRARIQVMEDSSEEEEEEKSLLDEPESKLIKFDREVTPEPKATRSPSPIPEEKPKNAKHKAKRWVTKRFETDDGFIRTEKVLEEYSASEDETVNDENRKKNSPPAKPVPEAKSEEKKSKTNGTAKSNNTKANGTAKTKQGSIMNFFTKK